MKSRSGFVSNSSSSSFIVFNNGPLVIPDAYQGQPLVVDENFGHTRFGWEWEDYYDFGSKVIFAYLQARYVAETHPEWQTMLEKVLKETLRITNIEWLVRDAGSDTHIRGKAEKIEGEAWAGFYDRLRNEGFLDLDNAYIDHQSASHEGQNTEIFENEERLKNFLFDDKTYIRGGNDNDGPYDDDYRDDLFNSRQ